MSRDAVQARRPLTGAPVPTVCGVAGTIVHTTDGGNQSDPPFGDEVALFLHNPQAGPLTATVTITGGAPLVIAVPGNSTVQAFFGPGGQPISAQPDNAARTITVADPQSTIVAFGWFERG